MKSDWIPKWPLWYKVTKIKQVNLFMYFGVMLTPAFPVTKHISTLAVKCMSETAKIGYFKRFGIESCLNPWRLKIRPIIADAARTILVGCTHVNIEKLDGIKIRCLKRCLGVTRVTSNTLFFKICRESTLIKELEGCSTFQERFTNIPRPSATQV